MRKAAKAVNKPNGPSSTASYAPTEHSKSVEDRLGELHRDLLAQREYRRRIVVSATAAILGMLLIAGEISMIAAEVVAGKPETVAVLFAISSAAALLGVAIALVRLTRADAQGPLVGWWCFTSLMAALLVSLVGAYVAAWPH
jgi:hypothetical protein